MQLIVSIHRRTMRKPATVRVHLHGSDRRPDVDSAFRAMHKALVDAFFHCSEEPPQDDRHDPRCRPCNARLVFLYRRADAPRPWSIRPDLSPAATVAECNTVSEVSQLLEKKGFRVSQP